MTLRARLQGEVGKLSIDLALETSGAQVLVGPNGAGKTTTLLMLLGVLPVQRGHIQVGDRVLLDTATSIDRPVEQRQLGYVPQEYALFPHLTVRQHLAFAVACAPGAVERSARAKLADALLSELALESIADRRVRSLSGGEKQRVALARALSVGPRALLLDEPLSALDVHARRDVREFLAGYLVRLQIPTIVVTHDAADAKLLGERIAVLERGRIVQLGSWESLRAAPATEFVRELVRT